VHFTNTKIPEGAKLYSRLEPISVDYGIMERSSKVLMVPASFHWSDLGSWAALDEIIQKDDAGNIRKGNTIDIGSQNSTVFAGERLIATIGLKGMVVVDTPDATLVTPKEMVQEVRRIVDELRQNKREEHLLQPDIAPLLLNEVEYHGQDREEDDERHQQH
jgi:hypothetical protein